jgi:signal transduction histidine kinase
MMLFRSYLKKQAGTLLMLILFAGLLLAILRLYGAPLEGALYGLLLCLGLGLGFLAVGFLRYRRRHEALRRALSQLREGLPALPDPLDAPEADYQDMLTALDEDRHAVAAAAAAQRDRAETFYTAWVHQIKTPLAAMGLLLQSGMPDPTLLKGELFSMEKYVDLVLTYQRLGSDTTDLVLKSCDLDDLIRAAVKEYAKLFILKKLTLTFTPTGLSVLTDEKWLGFVLGQLLGNALKYTQKGGVSVYARGSALVIEDTGMGIPASELPRVFEKSFTGENGRAESQTTGLGLYLCKRACGLLGHGISAESEAGKGTKVILDLSRPHVPVE